MDHPALLIVPLAVIVASAVANFTQQRYYARVVKETAGRYDRPGLALVTGVGRGRGRGAVVVLVVRRTDLVVEHALVLAGVTTFARFRPRPQWVGRPADQELPGASAREARAVTQALTNLPGAAAVTAPRLRGAVGLPPRPRVP